MKRALSVLFVLFAATLALAAPREENLTFPAGSGTGMGLLVTPEGKGPFPAVLVIQEWWGVDDWIKNRARALAKEGYVALAVDLYHGKVTNKQEEAHQLVNGLDRDRALADLDGAFAFLASRPDVRKDRIGAIGFCLGGGYALALATRQPRLAAVVAYYGLPPTDAAAIAKIQAPVLGNYGADDEGPSPEQVKTFEAALKKGGKSVDVKLYEGAGHAFANENNPWGGYREAAAKDAWARTLRFFDANLKRK
jgi:carboxymethylenebutenolidase